MLETSRCNLLKTGVAFLVLSFGAACGSSDSANPANGGGDGGVSADGRSLTVPMVVSATPLAGAKDVPLNANASATFSEAMDSASLPAAFTLTSGTTPVPGTLIYANSKAVFWPSAHFAPNSMYTATIDTGAKSASGVSIAAKYAWSFTTGTTVAPGAPVSLGSANAYVILAKAGISTVTTSAVTGDIAASPVAASYITGFSLTADPSKTFSTSAQVIGKVFAADDKAPTPFTLTTAVNDMELAFTDAAARAPDVTELGAGNIGGKTLVPGVYKWSTGLLIPSDVTLSGSATDVWVFQIAQNLNISSATKVILAGGAVAKNIVWQVSGLANLDTTAHCEGTIMSKTMISLQTGATINGRLHAQTAVTIAGSTVTQPAL